ncbi:MAG: hypothetical protein ACO3XO_06775 [Bdellovibrionota bacterium]|jgi:hypothetical protein
MKELGYRGRLIRIVTFLAGVYFFLEFLLPKNVLEAVGVADLHDEISNGFIVVGTMAFGLGIINLFRVHGTRVVFRRRDWAYSAALLSGLVLMMSVTTLDWLNGLAVTAENRNCRNLGRFAEVIVEDAKSGKVGVPTKDYRVRKLEESVQSTVARITSERDLFLSPLLESLNEVSEERLKQLDQELSATMGSALTIIQDGGSHDESVQALGQRITETGVIYEKILRIQYEQSWTSKLYLFFFEGLFVSLGSAMFSLLGVYIASAAYRAFRIRSVESLLMMVAAILVMLGQISFYEYISDDLPAIRQWLLEVPNTAAFRAIKIGAMIAGLVMAFRMWFSIESESFSSRNGRS